MAKTQEPTEAEASERDLTAYLEKSTPSLEFYAEWLKDVVGFNPDTVKNRDQAFARGVYLAVSLHRDFQVSEENARFKEEQKAAREAMLEEQRAEREAAKEAKAAERAAAEEAAEEARAAKQAEKQAAKAAREEAGKTPATKAAATTSAKPTAKAAAKPAPRATTRPARGKPVRAGSKAEAPF